MSENALGQANEIRTTSIVSSQCHNNGGGVGQGHLGGNGQPAAQRGALEPKEEKVEPQDYEGMAEALLTLLRDPAPAKNMDTQHEQGLNNTIHLNIL